MASNIKLPNRARAPSWILILSLGLWMPVGAVFSPRVLAVGSYKAPCGAQSDHFIKAKKNLEKCVDQLERTIDQKPNGVSCLNDLLETAS